MIFEIFSKRCESSRELLLLLRLLIPSIGAAGVVEEDVKPDPGDVSATAADACQSTTLLLLLLLMLLLLEPCDVAWHITRNVVRSNKTISSASHMRQKFSRWDSSDFTFGMSE